MSFPKNLKGTIPALAAALLITYQSDGKEFYISDLSQLQVALNEAAVNGEDDIIYLPSGFYDLTKNFKYEPEEKNSLYIKSQGFTVLQRKATESFIEFSIGNIDNDNEEKRTSLYIEDIIFSDINAGFTKKHPLLLIKGKNVDLRLKNCIFSGNFTKVKDGIVSINLSKSKIYIQNNIFSGNKSDEKASSLKITGDQNIALLEKNYFYSNKAKEGIVSFDISNSDLFLLKNTFMNNSTWSYLGDSITGIILRGKNTSALFVSNYFYGNISNNYGSCINILQENGKSSLIMNKFIYSYSRYGKGGSLYVEQGKNSTLELIKNEFHYNTAEEGGSSFIKSVDSKIFLGNNIFNRNYTYSVQEDNDVEKAGALLLELINSTSIVMNNLFYANYSHGLGGGTYISVDNDSKLKVFNNIFWENTMLNNIDDSLISFDDIFIDNAETSRVYIDRNVYKALAATGKELVFLGENFSENPLLENPDIWDFHLKENSYCIDTGILPDNDYIPLTFYRDLDDEPRIIGESIDIGPDEFNGENVEIENSEGRLFIDEAYKIYTQDKVSKKLIKLLCIDNYFNRDVKEYKWDIDGDGVIDFLTLEPYLYLDKHINKKYVKCIVTYTDGSEVVITY
jgi:hypothetical protein